MKNQICYAAVIAALLGGTSLAQAQTLIAQEPFVVAPAAGAVVAAPPAGETVVAPVETVETVRTVRSTRTARARVHVRHIRHHARGVTTTRTVVTRRIIETPAVAAITQPAYTEVVQPGIAPTYATPLYDVAGAPVMPPAMVGPPAVAVTTYPAPLYDVAPAPFAPPAVFGPPAVAVTTTYPAPLYDTVPAASPPPGLAVVPAYRYVYEPDRILVIDPVTGIAVQSIPR
jgi:hypothetical protein